MFTLLLISNCSGYIKRYFSLFDPSDMRDIIGGSIGWLCLDNLSFRKLLLSNAPPKISPFTLWPLPAMSSLRNVIQRRNHRERGQLAGRERLGLLEKKKDYLLRAKDYHSKQRRLKALREKALFRNPDEFYFKMINSRTKVIKTCWHVVGRSSQLTRGPPLLYRTACTFNNVTKHYRTK